MRSYLLKIGRTWYYRIRIPRDLKRYFPRSEIKKSLRTTRYESAKSIVRGHLRQTEQIFTQIRTGMLNEREIKTVVGSYMDNFLLGVERHRDNAASLMDALDAQQTPRGIDGFDFADFDGGLFDLLFDPSQGPERIDRLQAEYEQRTRKHQEQIVSGYYSDRTRRMVKRMVIERRLPVELPPREWFSENEDEWFSAPPQDFNRMCREFLKTEIAMYKVELQRLAGNWDNTYDTAAREKKENPPMLLSELIVQFKKEKSLKGEWIQGTMDKNEGVFNFMMEVIGDIDIRTITKTTIMRAFEIVQKYPSNRTKHKRYKGKTVEQLLAMPEVKALSEKSVNYYMGLISSVLSYAVENELGVARNYAEGLQVKESKKPSEYRLPYSTDEIEGMFRELAKIRRLIEPEKFWIPLLALHSGARSNELCQLHVADITEKEGVWCISVIEDEETGQRAKTASSIRTFPVHRDLIKIGFLKYVEKMRNEGQERMWPNLELKRGKYNQDFGKWYNRTFEKKFIVKDGNEDRKSFHSTRHTFINFFKQNVRNVDVAVLKGVVGHLDKHDRSGTDITWDL